MQRPMEMDTFVERCSDIQLDRVTALAQESPYCVYLDVASGYPQVKIVAQSAVEYEAMDRLLESPSSLSHVSGGQDYFAIHDNYSFYPTHDDFTYTIPLTHANFVVLRHLFSHKKGFEHIEQCYQELAINLAENFKQAQPFSRSYAVYQMLRDYGGWESDTHLYTQISGSDGTHIEQLRGWQATLLSDPFAAVFVNDEGEPLLNDMVAAQLDETVIEDYRFRYQGETAISQQGQIKQQRLLALASNESVTLCGIYVEANLMDIFLSYSMTAMQCQNDIYKQQTSHEAFTARMKAEPLLATLSLPTQLELVTSLGGNGRWRIDGSNESLKAGSSDDFTHRAWQCGVYYKAHDATDVQMLKDIGLERLADTRINNALVCLPYAYFKVLVLCINVQKNSDIDVKEALLERCTTLLDTLLAEGAVFTVPEIVMDEISAFYGSSDPRIERYCDINRYYFDTTVLPSQRAHALEKTIGVLNDWREQAAIDESDCHGESFVAPVYDLETKTFVPVHLSYDDDKSLLAAILALTDPRELTLQFIRQFKEDPTATYHCGAH